MRLSPRPWSLLVAAGALGVGCYAGASGSGDAGRDAGEDLRQDAASSGARPDSDSDAGFTEVIEADLCGSLDCGAGSCDAVTGGCVCPAAQFFDGRGCAQVMPCLADGGCPDRCPLPRVQALDVVRGDEILQFETVEGATLEVGVAPDASAAQPDKWMRATQIAMAAFVGQRVRVFARIESAECMPVGFLSRVYDVREAYPGAATEPGSPAVHMDDARVAAWASEVIDYTPGADVGAQWRDADQALGRAEGTSADVVVLGNGGSITLGFGTTIADGEGAELAVFENGFSSNFLELARIEVSSDGVHFVAFDGASRHQQPVAPQGVIAPEQLHGFAGGYQRGYGSPFDFALLRQHPAVVAGQLALQSVTHVRVVDIIGDGSARDAFDRVIYDPYPNMDTGGFDLDAVAVLEPAP